MHECNSAESQIVMYKFRPQAGHQAPEYVYLIYFGQYYIIQHNRQRIIQSTLSSF